MLENNLKEAMGWLGRQVGFVKAALKEDPSEQKVVYRKDEVEEKKHPEDPNVTLRRTTIDEVIVKKPELEPKKSEGNP